MSKQIYAININLSKFENNQIWQVAKSATASHLIYEKEMQFRKLANFVEVCNFAQHLWFLCYENILMIRQVYLVKISFIEKKQKKKTLIKMCAPQIRPLPPLLSWADWEVGVTQVQVSW